MALTWGGKALTASYQQGLAALSRHVGRQAYAAASVLDPDDIDGSAGRFVSATHEVLRRGQASGDVLSRGYVRQYAQREGLDLPNGVVGPVSSTADDLRSLVISGPIKAKSLIGRGVPREEAVARARRSAAEEVQYLTKSRSGKWVLRTAQGNHLRARRVTVGKTCAFCCMLAARGPVYTTDTVTFRAHPHCDCTFELSNETPKQWLAGSASDDERAFNEVYERAYAEAHEGRSRVPRSGEGSVVWRMRRLQPDLFTDGVFSE